MVKYRTVTKIRKLAFEHDVGNLKLVSRVLLFANVSKSTRKSTHGTRLCGVAPGLHTVDPVNFAVALI